MSKKFDIIFVLPGNHEYYFCSVSEGNRNIQSICDEFENISFLNNKIEEYNGIYFVGSTLWGDLSKTDTSQYKINDVIQIKGMNAKTFQALYEENKRFLSNALDSIVISHYSQQASASKTCSFQLGASKLDDSQTIKPKIVVITHHLPSYALTSNEFREEHMKKYSGWFTGNLDDILVRHDKNIAAWVYGHTHTPSVQRIHWNKSVGNADDRTHTAEEMTPGVALSVVKISKCVYYCNPIGYPDESVAGKEQFDAFFEL